MMRNCKDAPEGRKSRSTRLREEKGYESKKCRHIKLIKIEVEGENGRNAATILEPKNAGKQDEENRMNGNRRKSGSDAKRLARNNG